MKELDIYIYVIVALIPLSSLLVVFQVNPYQALVLRGILGAVAAMSYAILGAGDVALTEALVGTLLAITLYAVAVRSSLVLKLGSIEPESDPDLSPILEELRTIFNKHYMRLELIPYKNREELNQALHEKEIHAICTRTPLTGVNPYSITTRLQRLYEIMSAELASLEITLVTPNQLDNTQVQETQR
jgi:putative multicomponent Na+:H+ antiporter subunit B